MRATLKAVVMVSAMVAVGMVSGCGGSGSGSGSGSTAVSPSSNAGTAAGASSAGASSAQLSAGAVLYASNCAGCHGNITATTIATPTSPASIQGAIQGDLGGMSMFAALSNADIQSIADAVNNPSAVSVTPVPIPSPSTPVDGVALYGAKCAGCHGVLASSAKKGITLVRLQNAITANTGNMGFLSTLTSVEQQAIVTALAVSVTPTPTPTPAPIPTPITDGATLYATSCAACHGVLASSAKAGATATRIQTAINGNIGGMGALAALSTTQVSAIATALAVVTPTPAPAPACGSCHAIPPATGKHAFHTSQRVACATCHGSGYSTTTVNAATHNNGVKNLTTTIGWNSTARSCSNSCHSSKTW